MASYSRPIIIKEKSRSFLSTLLAFYNEQLHTHPLRTKAITAGILTGLQEFLAQELRFFISGPLGHVLFEISNKIFKNRAGSGTKLLQILVTLLVIFPIQHIASSGINKKVTMAYGENDLDRVSHCSDFCTKILGTTSMGAILQF
ncbi:2180_t:CDS:2, partial [Cetraspora pellucida]